MRTSHRQRCGSQLGNPGHIEHTVGIQRDGVSVTTIVRAQRACQVHFAT